MKKVREITLTGLLDKIISTPTLEERLLKDLPKNKKFTVKVLMEYYKISKNVIYPTVHRLEEQGILKKSKGNFANRNNVTVYERIK